MKTKNSIPSSHFAPEDICASCGSPCDIEKDVDDKDYCNDCRPKEMKRVITEVVKKEARKEALDIMSKCDMKYINGLHKYYNDKSFNVVCMVIDSAKCKLIQDKKMKSKKTDHFGVVGDFYVSIKNNKWKIQK